MDNLKRGQYLRDKDSGTLYVVEKRFRKNNRRCGWYMYKLVKVGTNLFTFGKPRDIKKYYKLDNTAQVLYG